MTLAPPTIDAPLASFDVFDTLITRPLAVPRDAFVLVARRLVQAGRLDEALVGGWAQARARAEAELRQARSAGEIRLQEIAERLATDARWPTLDAATIADAEIATELALWRPIAAGRQLVEQARRAGRRVVFVSDMYLPRSAIETGLDRLGIRQAGEPVFLSSEAGHTKHDGSLFAHTARELGARAADFQHLGDNAHADLKMARRAGWGASLFTVSRPNVHEAIAADFAALPAHTRTLLAGAMRSARLAQSVGDARQAAIVATSAGVVAPLMLAYVLWCVQSAVAAGRRQLHFLARDGQLLHKIATVLGASPAGAAAFGPWAAHYLYGSRQAWHPAAIVDLDQGDFEWIFTHDGHTLNLDKLAYRLGVDAAALQAQVGMARVRDRSTHLTADQVATLKQAMTQDTPLRRFVLQAAAARRQKVRRYFEQEGALDASACALVDAGWQGNLQRSYERITGSPHSCGFYLGLQRRPSIAPQAIARAWLFDRVEARGPWFLPVIPLIETFLEADHGTTVDYDEAPGAALVPALQSRHNEAALGWGLAHQHRAVEAVVAEFLTHARADDVLALAGTAGQALGSALMEDFVCRPTPEAAQHYGDFPKTSSQNHDDWQKLAPSLSRSAAWRLLMDRHRPADPKIHWSYASYVRSDLGGLRHLQRAKDALRRRLRSSR